MALSDKQLELIHAALDGELTPEEQQHFDQLLELSPVARHYYQAWRRYQQLLQEKVAPYPPEAEVVPVVRCYHSNDTVVTSLTPVAGAGPYEGSFRQRRRSVRSPLILAFSLLVAVGAAGLTLRLLGPPPPAVPPQEQHANIHGVAAIENPTPAGPISPAPAPGGSTHPSAPAITPGSGNDTAPTQPRAPGPGVSDLAVAPPPREANWDLFTAPLPPPVRISLAEVQPPFLRPLADFDRDEVAGTFLRQLQREPAVRIDVFTRDLHRGIQWLQKTAAQAGLHLFVDATTADRLKKNQPLTAVLLYCDGLTAEELTRLFLLLQAEDARISPRLFDMVHLMPLSPTDERELREVLGVDPQLGTKPRPERPEKAAAEVPQRPLSADTVDTIIQSLLNKGRIDKSALVTAWGPPAARVQPLHSAEIKAYLARRSTRPPRAVPALIIVRLPYS